MTHRITILFMGGSESVLYTPFVVYRKERNMNEQINQRNE